MCIQFDKSKSLSFRQITEVYNNSYDDEQNVSAKIAVLFDSGQTKVNGKGSPGWVNNGLNAKLKQDEFYHKACLIFIKQHLKMDRK